MLCLVLFTVGFIYYFRRQAWHAHTAIESNYRIKNKKMSDPKASKGGIFSLENIKMKRRDSQSIPVDRTKSRSKKKREEESKVRYSAVQKS